MKYLNKKALLSTPILLFVALANPAVAGPLDWLFGNRVPFQPTSQGFPSTVGGAVRGNSCDDTSNILALNPQDSNHEVMGKNKNLVLPIQQKGLSGKNALVTISNDQYYAETEITLPDTEVALLNTNLSLPEGDYRWRVNVACGEDFTINDPIVMGNVAVTNADSDNDIEKNVVNGKWYDSLSTAVASHTNQSSDLLPALLTFVSPESRVNQASITILDLDIKI